MISLQFNYDGAKSFLATDIFSNYEQSINHAYQQLVTETGKGQDFLGWRTLPQQIGAETLQALTATAERLSKKAEVIVVVGIGGSYLGARAVIDALQSYFHDLTPHTTPTILYAGNNLSEDYLFDLLNVLNQKEYALLVISKSGTTTEPAIAFRILKEHCEHRYGKAEASQRIVAITDESKGALKKLADKEQYTTFVIPDNVGGRYSVLTPVGLLPIALAGFDIAQLVAGAAAMQQHLHEQQTVASNPAMQYAVLRKAFLRNNKMVEIMAAYEPRLTYLIEWYKQLFGESEGKEQKGIFPAGCIFSTDLHSLGQYIQEGSRMLFLTTLSVAHSQHHVAIPSDSENIDGLNYLCNKSITEINHTAEQGTRMAHIDGGVPNLQILIPEINAYTLGELIYFFEFSCALCGYLLEINPFNQPGVEAYKRNMFQLLGKPGI